MFKKTMAVVTACALSSCSLVSSCLYRPVRASAESFSSADISEYLFDAIGLEGGTALHVYAIYLQLVYQLSREVVGDSLSYDISTATSVTGYYYLNVPSNSGHPSYTKGTCTSFSPNVDLIYNGDALSERSYTLLTSSNGSYSAAMYKPNGVYISSHASYSSGYYTFSTRLSSASPADYTTTGTEFFEGFSDGGTSSTLDLGCSYGPTGSTNYPYEYPHWLVTNKRIPPNNPVASPAFHVGFPHSPYNMPSATLSTPEEWDNYAKDTLLPYVREIDPDVEDYITDPLYKTTRVEQFPYQNLPSLPSPSSFPELFLDGASFWFTRFDELVSGISLKPVLITMLVIGALSILIVGV